VNGFEPLADAQAWVWRFVERYNTEHRHSGLNFVPPQQRDAHEAPAIMEHRVAVYAQALAQPAAVESRHSELVIAGEHLAEPGERDQARSGSVRVIGNGVNYFENRRIDQLHQCQIRLRGRLALVVECRAPHLEQLALAHHRQRIFPIYHFLPLSS
jgi:hypothetical protein